jgi:hypothetical protein
MRDTAVVAAHDETPVGAGERSAVVAKEITPPAVGKASRVVVVGDVAVAPAHGSTATIEVAPTDAHSVSPAATSCQNCGAPLSGQYCAACGQRHEPHIHSLREFLAEATESITHADSRLWRTLGPLLAKPGFLTKEFLEGRRARYLPPFRLYLVLSVVFFVVAAAGAHTRTLGIVGLHTGDGELSVNVQTLDDMRSKPAETPEQRADRICNDFNFRVGSNKGLLDGPALCRKVAGDNGRELLTKLYHNIPHALIVLLPLLALTMRLMYLRRHYVEHLLFFVHAHAFAFVFLTVYVLIIRFIPSSLVFGLATAGMLFGLPYYTYRAMLRVYGQRKWVTRSKFMVLSLSYFTLGFVMTVLLGLYTAATL